MTLTLIVVAYLVAMFLTMGFNYYFFSIFYPRNDKTDN